MESLPGTPSTPAQDLPCGLWFVNPYLALLWETPSADVTFVFLSRTCSAVII